MNDKTEDRPDDGSSASDNAAAPEPARDTKVAAAAEAAPAADAATAPGAPPAVVKKSSGVGILALLVALAAAAGTGYLWYEQQAQRIVEARVAELGRDLERRSAELDRILNSIDELTRSDQALDDDVAELTDRIEADMAGLPERVTRLETALEKVPGISDKARSSWLRSEAEYFLRVANAQLNLAGNVGVSLRALDLADAQLRALADPALTPVREAIANERAALKAVPQPDAEGIVLALGSLARSLDQLDFARVAPGSYRGEASGAPGETGWRRAWRAVVDALKSVISVKRDDRQVTPLLTEAEETMLVRSLDVDLQIARLAVIRNEGELYRRALAAARERLAAYFDANSAGVVAALETIDELALAELPEQLPDISASLTLLMNTPGGEAAQ
jgi:uncharacterized protein HemX